MDLSKPVCLKEPFFSEVSKFLFGAPFFVLSSNYILRTSLASIKLGKSFLMENFDRLDSSENAAGIHTCTQCCRLAVPDSRVTVEC